MTTEPTIRPPGEGDPPPLSAVRIVGILLCIGLMAMIVILELTLVYPALRAMVPVFRTDSIGWVVTIMLLAGVGTQAIIGKLADIHGKKTVLLAVSLLFLIGSVLAAAASSFAILLVGRALQGASLGIATLVNGVIRDVLPARIVPIGMGVLGAKAGLGAVLGPFLSGWLLQTWGWRGIFAFGAVYIAILIPIFFWLVPNSPIRAKHRIDYCGALLLGGGVGLLFLLIHEGSHWAWISAYSLVAFVGGVGLLALFVRRSLRIDHPLIDLRVVGHAPARTVFVIALLGNWVIGAFALLVPLMLQTPASAGLGYGFGISALVLGLYYLPYGLGAFTLGPLSGLVTRARGPAFTLRWSMASLTLSLVSLGLFHATTWQVLIGILIYGIGNGTFYAVIANLVVDSVPRDQVAVATGVQGLAQNIGAGTATATISGLLVHRIHHTDSSGQIFYSNTGFVVAFLLGAAGGLIGLVMALREKNFRLARGPEHPKTAPHDS